MMKASMRKLLRQAQEGHYALPATNFVDWLSAQAYVETSEALGKPLILAFAQAHTTYLSLEEAAYIGRYFQSHAKTPIVLHLDHGQDEDFIVSALDLGFNSVMMDASQEPFDLNVARTRRIIELVGTKDIAVEAEIGFVGTNGRPNGQEAQVSIYTEVADAQAFVAATKVDSLAVSIGTSHGLYQGVPQLNFQRLAELSQALDVPLVLHGGSSSGDANLQRCAQSGIAKINIFSDFMTAAYQARLHPASQDYAGLQLQQRKAIGAVLAHYYQIFQTPTC